MKLKDPYNDNITDHNQLIFTFISDKLFPNIHRHFHEKSVVYEINDLINVIENKNKIKFSDEIPILSLELRKSDSTIRGNKDNIYKITRIPNTPLPSNEPSQWFGGNMKVSIKKNLNLDTNIRNKSNITRRYKSSFNKNKRYNSSIKKNKILKLGGANKVNSIKKKYKFNRNEINKIQPTKYKNNKNLIKIKLNL